MKKNSENNEIFLYTVNLKFDDMQTRKRISDIYDIIRYGYSTKNKAAIIFGTLNLEGDGYDNFYNRELLVEYSEKAIKKKIEKFTIGSVGMGIWSMNVHGVSNRQMSNDNLQFEKLKRFEKEYNEMFPIKVKAGQLVNTNFCGTLFPGETPPQNGSYRRDIKLEHFELERKQINRPVPNVDVPHILR
jgi:hypothetical protein